MTLQSGANDGSLAGAVAAMSDLDVGAAPASDDNLISFEEAQNRDAGLPPPDVMSKARQQPRAENGQFKPTEKAAEQPKPQASDAAKAAEAQPAAEESTPADEFFELPPEKEGEQPRRIPATEVFEGYQRAQQLAEEVAQLRRGTPPPQAWDEAMYAAVQTRGELIQRLQMFEQAMVPDRPNMELINPESPHYNPAAYHQQTAVFDQAVARLQQVRHQREMLEQQQGRERGALVQARQMREQQKLLEFWPEIRDQATQRQVLDDAAKLYDVTPQDFAEIHDSRLYRMLKDALAYHNGQRQRQAAIKVVRGVPKLVKAPARSAENRSQQTYSSAMQRLQRSGSLEDAANAIGGLL